MRNSMRRKAEYIVRTLREHGFKSYYAGGCVRDMMMGMEPTDYDIVTNALPDDVIRLFDTVVPVGKEFGVVVVVIDKQPFEVATFRKEGEYLDGRRPSSVVFTDEEEDARRRDFTINGIFYDPVQERYIDYVDGESDIHRGIIRSIGNPEKRLREDKLRLIRGVRFAARFRFAIEMETEKAIVELAPRVADVSAERIRDELVKILTGPHPDEGIRLMHRLGLLEIVLPEASRMDGVEQPPEFHPEGDVFTHTMLMLEEMWRGGNRVSCERDTGGEESEGGVSTRTAVSSTLAMGVLLHDIGKPDTMEISDRIRFNNHTSVGAEMAGRIMKRLRFSKKETRLVVSLVRDHLKFIEVRKMRESTLKRFLMMECFEEHLELHRLDCLASHRDLENYMFCRDKLQEWKKISPPPPKLLSGQDLQDLGFDPGPLFKEILTFVEDLQLEGTIRSKEDAVRFVIEKFGKPGE